MAGRQHKIKNVKSTAAMLLRHKTKNTQFESWRFNTVSYDEVLTGDDSVSIFSLDVLINGEWKDMQQAFIDRDIIPDNLATYFTPPPTEQDKQRGYIL